MNISLEDKVIVITGSSRGLGKEMAICFAKEGATLAINYKKNRREAENAYEEIREYNSKAILVQADVTKQDDVKRLYYSAMNKFGKVDVLINNAGKCSDNYLHFMNQEQWKGVIETNLFGTYICSRFFLKAMLRKRSGKIINIASLKGQLGSEGQCNYSASKAGVIGFTKSLAKEVGKFGISVNAVCPGFIPTDLNLDNNIKKKYADEMSVLKHDRSLQELLSFMVWFVSDEIKEISGQVINLDSRIK